MKIHSDILTSADIRDAAQLAEVTFDRFEAKRSRSHARAYDVTLFGKSHRWPQGGRGAGDEHAATWDQWGVFLAVLFERDPRMVTPYYRHAAHFADRTADRFGAPETVTTSEGYRDVFKAYGWPEDAHGDHVFRPTGRIGEQACTKCSAIQRNV